LFNDIVQYIKNHIKESNKDIKLIDVTDYNGKKLEVVVSTDIHMASISVLPDYTYDFLAVEIENENIKLNVTKNCENLEKLKKEIEYDIIQFSKL